jgi:hypothetical protein
MIKNAMIASYSLGGEMPKPRKCSPRTPSKIVMRKLRGSWNAVEEQTSFSLAQFKIKNKLNNSKELIELYYIITFLAP